MRSLVLAGAIAGPVFLIAALVEGFRPGYDPVLMPISLLSAGPDGWTQAANFIVTGSLVVAGAIGLMSVLPGRVLGLIGPILLAIFGLGIIGAGFFSTDPALGYPPGVPPPIEPSSHSAAHDLASLVVFLDLPIACLVIALGFARFRESAWAWYSALTALALIVILAAVVIAFNTRSPIGGIGGLLQRIWLLVGFGWLGVVSLDCWRHRTGVAATSDR